MVVWEPPGPGQERGEMTSSHNGFNVLGERKEISKAPT